MPGCAPSSSSGPRELSARAEELRISRERLVDAQDAERRRLERDIHDGAQQHLVALAVNLRLAQTLAGRSPERADALLAASRRRPPRPSTRWSSLSRGIYPPLLAERGRRRGAPAAAISAMPVRGRAVSATAVGRYAAERRGARRTSAA